MYFRSIRFYKHLILFVLALIIAAPTGVCFVLLHSNHARKEQVSELHSIIEQMQEAQEQNDLNAAAEEEESKGGESAAQEIAEKEKENETEKDLPYLSMYPALYAEEPEQQVYRKGTVYLTFDDGPSERTLEILSVLDLYQIKATFFVIGKTDKESKAIMKKIVDSGHSLGLHTFSHDYSKIYASVESFLDDFERIYDLVVDATGIKPDIFRFAGGSINSYNSGLYKPLIAEMTRRGFTFYDWNACDDDTTKNASVQSIVKDATDKLSPDRRYILLMHDSAAMKNTVQALPKIIGILKDKGFAFETLTSEVKPIRFAYSD